MGGKGRRSPLAPCWSHLAPPPPTQGDLLDKAAEFIVKQFKTVAKKDIYIVDGKKKVRYFDDEDDE